MSIHGERTASEPQDRVTELIEQQTAISQVLRAETVGYIALGRKQVQPFTDKQISLFRDFAVQATIALESTRLQRQYREVQTALAQANRVATVGQLTASIAHEIKQPITAARTCAAAALRFLDKSPPDVAEVR